LAPEGETDNRALGAPGEGWCQLQARGHFCDPNIAKPRAPTTAAIRPMTAMAMPTAMRALVHERGEGPLRGGWPSL